MAGVKTGLICYSRQFINLARQAITLQAITLQAITLQAITLYEC